MVEKKNKNIVQTLEKEKNNFLLVIFNDDTTCVSFVRLMLKSCLGLSRPDIERVIALTEFAGLCEVASYSTKEEAFCKKIECENFVNEMNRTYECPTKFRMTIKEK